MACALVISVVVLWCKHQVTCKLGIAIEGPNAWYYVAVIKLKSFTCNHQVLTLELRAARQFFIDYVVEFIGCAIRKSESVSYLQISVSNSIDNKAIHEPQELQINQQLPMRLAPSF